MNQLKDNQIFSSMRELCEFLEIPYSRKNSKLNNKRVNCFCCFHRDGKRIIIDSVIKEPKPWQSRTIEFRYHKGDRISRETGELIIIDCYRNQQQKNIKFYRYQCNKCGYIGDISEAHLLDGGSCSSCRGRKTSKTANTNMWETNPEMASLLLNPEDGFNYRYTSSRPLDWKCPFCDTVILERKPVVVYISGLGCRKCGKGISYPNKLFEDVLKQLGIQYFSEKRYSWCKFKKYHSDDNTFGVYDFAIEKDHLIVELDGGLGHGEKTFANQKDPEETKYNDMQKDILARENGYRIVRVDVDYKKFRDRFDYCKHNIIKSLRDAFDFSGVDWDKANENAMTSFYIPVCEKYNEGYTIEQIAEEFALWTGTVRDYLVQGTKNGITSYDSNIRLTKKYLEERGFTINSRRDQAEAAYTFITEYIKIHPDKTREQIAKELGISSATVWNYLFKYPKQYGFGDKNQVLPRKASPRKRLERRGIEELPDNAVSCRGRENLFIDPSGNVYRKTSKGNYSILPHKQVAVGKRIEIRVNYTVPGGRNIPVSVARLLAENFIVTEGKCPNIYYKDGDSTNISISNIRIGGK